MPFPHIFLLPPSGHWVTSLLFNEVHPQVHPFLSSPPLPLTTSPPVCSSHPSVLLQACLPFTGPHGPAGSVGQRDCQCFPVPGKSTKRKSYNCFSLKAGHPSAVERSVNPRLGIPIFISKCLWFYSLNITEVKESIEPYLGDGCDSTEGRGLAV